MIRRQFANFICNWLISSTGMWLCIQYFGQVSAEYAQNPWLYVCAGLLFSLVNSIIRPIVKIFALPFIIVSLGAFSFIISSAMTYLVIRLLPGVTMGLWGIIYSTIIMGIVNGLANLLISMYNGS